MTGAQRRSLLAARWRVWLLLVLPLGPALLSAWWQPLPLTRSETAEVRWAVAVSWPEVLWIDARKAEAFALSHVAGALPLAPGSWASQVEAVLLAWIPGQRVVVYCGGQGCAASREVARRLREEMGLADVYVLQGGWDGQTGLATPGGGR